MLKNLGKFTILSELGHGAMGVVYRAEDNLGDLLLSKFFQPALQETRN